jgi:hypothetical protein
VTSLERETILGVPDYETEEEAKAQQRAVKNREFMTYAQSEMFQTRPEMIYVHVNVLGSCRLTWKAQSATRRSPAFILEGAAAVELCLVTQVWSLYTRQMMQIRKLRPKQLNKYSLIVASRVCDLLIVYLKCLPSNETF